MNKKTYVEYFDGRRMFTETETKEVDDRDPKAAYAHMPSYCFGFRFFDLTWKIAKTDDGEEFKVDQKRVNVSETYYPDGEIYNLERVKKELPQEKILISNMENNNWPTVVRTRHGNFVPFDECDQI